MNETHRRHRRKSHRSSKPFTHRDLVVIAWMLAMFWGMRYGIKQVQNEVQGVRTAIVQLQERFSKDDQTLAKIEQNTLSLQSDLARMKIKIDQLATGSVLEIN